jgi:ornithine decarboxylase
MPLQKVLMLAQERQKTIPIILKHPVAAANAAKTFLTSFLGQTMYAVKANTCPDLLWTLWDSGIRSFDVASIHEIRNIRSQLPSANLNFMNPIKSEQAVREAYTIHGVRSFSFDTKSELEKILRVTGQDISTIKSLTLCLRIRVESLHAKLAMSQKFGATAEEAITLLRAARGEVQNLGICFHVGSQSMDPEGHRQGLLQAHRIAHEAGVRIDVIDIGGGFPVEYPGLKPPPLSRYFEAIHRTWSELPLFRDAQLWSEPGRALCAEYNSIVARVEAVKGHLVYINNGLYGDLHDPSRYNWPLDAILLGDLVDHGELGEFSLCGPTCDDEDFIRGPIKLPKRIAPGDAIWCRTVGAYGTALRTKFNGCSVEVEEYSVAG